MSHIALTCWEKIAEYLAALGGRKLGYCSVSMPMFRLSRTRWRSSLMSKLEFQVESMRPQGTRKISTQLSKIGWMMRAQLVSKCKKLFRTRMNFPKGASTIGAWNLNRTMLLVRLRRRKLHTLLSLEKKGRAFQRVSCPAPPKPLIMPTSSTISLVSQRSMLNDIIESLKNEETSMIGICGMGGVGKSTMMEKAKKNVWEKSLLDEIAKTVFSQNSWILWWSMIQCRIQTHAFGLQSSSLVLLGFRSTNRASFYWNKNGPGIYHSWKIVLK